MEGGVISVSGHWKWLTAAIGNAPLYLFRYVMSDDVSSELKAIINEGNNSIKQYIDKLQAYYLNVKESQKSVPSPDKGSDFAVGWVLEVCLFMITALRTFDINYAFFCDLPVSFIEKDTLALFFKLLREHMEKLHGTCLCNW